MQSIHVAPAEEEYIKNEDLNHDDVLYLIEWLKTQPHLPELTELEIITFFHACVYDMDETKKIIDHHFTFRTHCDEFFKNRMPNENLQKKMDVAVTTFLPGLTPDGYAVMFAKLIDTNTQNFYWSELVKILGMVSDLFLLKNGTCAGIIVLLDMEGTTFGHLMKISPPLLKKTIAYFRDAVNARRRAIYIVHPVPFIDRFLSLAKPFLTKELIEMIHICKPDNHADIFEEIPMRMVPKYLGGDGLDVAELHESMKKIVFSGEEYFKFEEKFRKVDESLRQGRPINIDDLFGVEGSFRKLDID